MILKILFEISNNTKEVERNHPGVNKSTQYGHKKPFRVAGNILLLHG